MYRRAFHGQQQDRHGTILPFDAHSALVEGPHLSSSDQHLQSLCKAGLLARAVDALSQLHTLVSDATYLRLLKACIKLRLPTYAKQVHLHIACHRTPAQVTGFLGGYLVIALARCGAVEDAVQISFTLSHRTVFSWTAIISAYPYIYQPLQSLWAVLEAEHVLSALPEPDVVSWNAMLSVLVDQACGVLAEGNVLLIQSRSAKLVALDIGQAVHADADKSGFTADVLVGTTLASMYKKCGTLSKAENVFTTMRQHNAVSWTTMLSAYVEQGHGERALCFFRQMRVEGFIPNQLTYLFALQACVILADRSIGANGASMKVIALEVGRGLCVDACKENFLEEPSISSTVLSLYGKCGAFEEAEGLFDNLSVKNVVSWTAMLSMYVEQGQSMKALQLFEALKETVPVDIVVLLYVLQACSEAGSLLTCKQVHFDIVSSGHDSLPSAAATLIHAYGGCASIQDRYAVFDKASKPDIILWNVCCAGNKGDGSDSICLQMFEGLELASLEPDAVTFSAALSACNYAGDVSLGVEIFVSMMQDSGIHPDLRHYSIIIDLLVRAGNFRRVENMLEQMSTEADYALWFCILSACRMHGNVDLAKRAFDGAIRIMPNCASPYVMLSNIYAEAGLHELATEVENARLAEGAWEFGPELE
ncbi:hypothetical protein GOP47_0007647 [Adiantum capillus-veneris]|uniref:Pentatricopeptide repeat-containing protein n=1 Tax=Adiantum capillus-veneris TaxID=13818 RepID=A0A9D4V1Z7_ADICA|nr:hypothetical protein GOP47_0007647 [Adiantum capillus-veneris]